MFPDQDEELIRVKETLLHSRVLSSAPLRRRLFRLLWSNLREPTDGRVIWNALWPSDEQPYDSQIESNHGHPQNRVRKQCSDLGKALNDYFNKGPNGWDSSDQWVIELPPGGPKTGYQLKCRKLNDPHSLTRAFWQPHLDSTQPISLVYVEQRFFMDMSKGLVFRYYDCNEDDNDKAVTQLHHLHKEYRQSSLKAVHPYVARGEINARDAIVRWFRDFAFENVNPVVSRHPSEEDEIWKHSLILFGSAASNRFIRKILSRYHAFPIEQVDRWHVSLRNLRTEEMPRLEAAEKAGLCRISSTGRDACTLSFNPGGKIVPVVLTRVPNPYGTHPAVTILHSERGKAVEQFAEILTNDEQLRQALQRFQVEQPFPDAFQVLCAAPIRSHESGIHPLLGRVLGGEELAPFSSDDPPEELPSRKNRSKPRPVTKPKKR